MENIPSAKPASAFIFDRSFEIDRSKVLLVVHSEDPTTISVWMPEHVTENMPRAFALDVLAAVKDFLENVPLKGVLV